MDGDGSSLPYVPSPIHAATPSASSGVLGRSEMVMVAVASSNNDALAGTGASYDGPSHHRSVAKSALA